MKNKLTPVQEAQAIIYGSFILYSINALLEKSQRNNATTIRLFQMIRGKTSKPEYLKYVILSNNAWQEVTDKYKDKNYRLVIFDLVESIGFEVEEIMTKMYGKGFLNAISAFSLKQTTNVDSKILEESRIVSKSLIDSTRKVVFEYSKKKD